MSIERCEKHPIAAIQAQLAAAQGELRQDKESFHRRVNDELARQREALKIKAVVMEHGTFHEVLQITDVYDDRTIVVAPSAAVTALRTALVRAKDCPLHKIYSCCCPMDIEAALSTATGQGEK